MKRRLVALAAALAISASGATLVATQASADDGTAAVAAGAAYSSLPPFAGKTFLITVDNGNVYRNTYSADGTSLHSETVQGTGVGEVFDATLANTQVGLGLWFSNWVEPNGVTVSHVLNFANRTVQVYFTFATASGTRLGQLHSATLTRVA
ncbi:MoaF-related domain-containing protein [Kitasatospora sp. NBC_01539]|uniref:MoaF-related domain-containing protein n=1 Tax=Kitasatospora sp. NBC_01539 TaxID=2903577 RepID=UPI00386021B4